MIKFPHPSAVAQNGWTHQVNWQALNGPDAWVPCFSRHTRQNVAEAHADELRADPTVRDVQVNPIPKEEK
jgi:hypothetical protein